MSTERVIGQYKARLLEVSCHTDDPDWAWRKWYEGKTGQLYLMRLVKDFFIKIQGLFTPCSISSLSIR